MTGEAARRTPRYAIYFAPADGSRLCDLGSRWLGYDAATGRMLAPPVLDGIGAADWRRATAAPRKYGFHATLKPPFSLTGESTEDELIARLSGFAARQRAESAGRPVLSALSGFLALMPGTDDAAIGELAAACVADFDAFRSPPTDDELDRRRAAGLTDVEERLLGRWGSPYVMEAFRFHMTLTGRLERPDRDRFRCVIGRYFAPALSEELVIDSVCLFVQPALDAPFHLRERLLFRR